MRRQMYTDTEAASESKRSADPAPAHNTCATSVVTTSYCRAAAHSTSTYNTRADSFLATSYSLAKTLTSSV